MANPEPLLQQDPRSRTAAFECRSSLQALRAHAHRARFASRRWAPLAIAALAVHALACGGNAEGSVVVQGHPEGDFTIDFGSCASGAHRQFYGALVLADDLTGGIRAIKDPVAGDLIQIEVPGSCGEDAKGCRVIEVRPSACSTFEFDFEQTNNRVNLVWEVRGAVDMVCSVAGGQIEAHAVFSNCH